MTKDMTKYMTCDYSNCNSEVLEGIANNSPQPLQIGMLFWHDFADAGDLGADRMNNHHGTVVNAPTQFVGTGFGGGFGLDGGGDGTLAHIEKPWNKYIFDMGRNNWTISYWFYHDAAQTVTEFSGSYWYVGNPNSTLACGDVTWAHQGFNAGIVGGITGKTEFIWGQGETCPLFGLYGQSLITDQTITPNDNWNHIAVTFNASYLRTQLTYYINGVNAVTLNQAPEFWAGIGQPGYTDDDMSSVDGYLPHSYGEDHVMRFLRGVTGYRPGILAEPAMWSRELAADEVAALATGLSFDDALIWIR